MPGRGNVHSSHHFSFFYASLFELKIVQDKQISRSMDPWFGLLEWLHNTLLQFQLEDKSVLTQTIFIPVTHFPEPLACQE